MFTTADTGDMMSTLDVMTDATGLDVCAEMTISVRSRRDVVVVDPDRFLAAARLAMQDLDPSLTSAQAATAVTDVGDAVFALLDRDGDLAPATTPTSDDKGGARIPGTPVADRADGLAPTGALRQIVLDDLCTLRDHGCFLPDDPFALPARSLATIQECEPPAIGRGAHPDPDTARQPTATAPPGTPEPVVARLQAAALAAICALTDPYAGPIDGYPNPHTSDLAPYDLTSLFCFEPSGTPAAAMSPATWRTSPPSSPRPRMAHSAEVVHSGSSQSYAGSGTPPTPTDSPTSPNSLHGRTHHHSEPKALRYTDEPPRRTQSQHHHLGMLRTAAGSRERLGRSGPRPHLMRSRLVPGAKSAGT